MCSLPLAQEACCSADCRQARGGQALGARPTLCCRQPKAVRSDGQPGGKPEKSAEKRRKTGTFAPLLAELSSPLMAQM